MVNLLQKLTDYLRGKVSEEQISLEDAIKQISEQDFVHFEKRFSAPFEKYGNKSLFPIESKSLTGKDAIEMIKKDTEKEIYAVPVLHEVFKKGNKMDHIYTW